MGISAFVLCLAFLRGAAAHQQSFQWQPPSFFHHQQRALQLNLTEVQGSNATQVCANFEKFLFGLQSSSLDVFQTSCKCTADEDGSYDVDCKAGCTANVDGKEFMNSLSTALRPATTGEGFHGKFWEQCHKYVDAHFNATKICFGVDYFNSVNGEEWVRVDGQACNSVELVECGVAELTSELVNCSNLGYGASMNFCTGEGIEADGPFSYIYSGMHAENPSEVIGTCSDGSSGGETSSSSDDSSVAVSFSSLSGLIAWTAVSAVVFTNN